MRDICDRHGALLILDETAVCLGRTGRMFACEHFDVVPDILTLGKGLGGGIFPMAAMLAREGLNIAAHTALGHYTHEKNPVGCAAALAAIACITEEGLVARAERMGAATLARLADMALSQPLIAGVRGLGMLFGVALVSAEAADKTLYACLSRGLSFKVSGGNVLTLAPPLTITDPRHGPRPGHPCPGLGRGGANPVTPCRGVADTWMPDTYPTIPTCC